MGNIGDCEAGFDFVRNNRWRISRPSPAFADAVVFGGLVELLEPFNDF
jgi:hypothetical protein